MTASGEYLFCAYDRSECFSAVFKLQFVRRTARTNGLNRRPGATANDYHNPVLLVVSTPHLNSGSSRAADGDGAHRRNSVVADSPGAGHEVRGVCANDVAAGRRRLKVWSSSAIPIPIGNDVLEIYGRS